MKTMILLVTVILLAACASTDSGTHKTAAVSSLSDIAPAAGGPVVSQVHPCGPHRFCGNN